MTIWMEKAQSTTGQFRSPPPHPRRCGWERHGIHQSNSASPTHDDPGINGTADTGALPNDVSREMSKAYTSSLASTAPPALAKKAVVYVAQKGDDDKTNKTAAILQPAADGKSCGEQIPDMATVPSSQAEDDYCLPIKADPKVASKASATGKPKDDRMYATVATGKQKYDRRHELGYDNMTQKQKRAARSLPKGIYFENIISKNRSLRSEELSDIDISSPPPNKKSSEGSKTLKK
jgi:hypothetical protein